MTSEGHWRPKRGLDRPRFHVPAADAPRRVSLQVARNLAGAWSPHTRSQSHLLMWGRQGVVIVLCLEPPFLKTLFQRASKLKPRPSRSSPGVTQQMVTVSRHRCCLLFPTKMPKPQATPPLPSLGKHRVAWHHLLSPAAWVPGSSEVKALQKRLVPEKRTDWPPDAKGTLQNQN